MAAKTRRKISRILVAEPDGDRQVVLCVRETPDGNPWGGPLGTPGTPAGRRKLVRYDIAGVWFFCKFCKMEHPIDWDTLFALRLEEEGGTGKECGETKR